VTANTILVNPQHVFFVNQMELALFNSKKGTLSISGITDGLKSRLTDSFATPMSPMYGVDKMFKKYDQKADSPNDSRGVKSPED
jgi:hypothetical protein